MSGNREQHRGEGWLLTGLQGATCDYVTNRGGVQTPPHRHRAAVKRRGRNLKERKRGVRTVRLGQSRCVRRAPCATAARRAGPGSPPAACSPPGLCSPSVSGAWGGGTEQAQACRGRSTGSGRAHGRGPRPRSLLSEARTRREVGTGEAGLHPLGTPSLGQSTWPCTWASSCPRTAPTRARLSRGLLRKEQLPAS